MLHCRDRIVNLPMDYLAPEHQDLAKEGLDELREKLPLPQEDVLEKLKAEGLSFPRMFRTAQEYTSRNLPTASVIWEYMLGNAENKQQKFAVMNKLFQVQIATGPWKVALETAQKLFNETIAECSSDNSRQRTANEGGVDSLMASPLLFDAYLNLGFIHRLLKEFSKAEQLYKKALEIARSLKDSDKESSAKIHLAICLLDHGELKEAIETYFEPLMVFKTTMRIHTKALYLQHYGNACRSAADWGRAKEYLREAVDLAKEMKDVGLVSSCCGDLGNVFRSEGRYKDAERLHTAHHNFALNRGDIHGLAISCGNIGFLKFYNPEEFDDSVVLQFIEYSLAEEVGDFARMGIAFNKIGKLYTTIGYNEEAVEMFQVALDGARKAGNVAGEGMAWGNLGTVYRALERFEDAIGCHIKYRDNAERRMDIGGVAIMQHQLAMDYILSGNLPEAERSILNAFQTLEKIRSQIGEEDKSKLSNFEKNQAEAYNLLQVVLVAQMKYKESLVLADSIRGRALADIVKKRLCGYNNSSGTEATTLNEEFIAESFNNLLEVSRKLSTTLVFYSVVKEFDESGAFYTWVYAWVLHPSGRLNFNKSRLQHGIRETKVELNDEFVVSLRRSMGQPSHVEDLGKILRCEKHLSVSREAKAHIATLESEDVLNSLKGLHLVFGSGLGERKTENETNLIQSSLKISYKTREKAVYDRPNIQSDTHGKVENGKSLNGEPVEGAIKDAKSPSTSQVESHPPLSTLKSATLKIDQEPAHETGSVHSKSEKALPTTGALPESPPKVCLPEASAVAGSQTETEESSISEENKTFEDLTEDPATCPLNEKTAGIATATGETSVNCVEGNEETSQTITAENHDLLKSEDVSEASYCETLQQNEVDVTEQIEAFDAIDVNPNESPHLFENQKEKSQDVEGAVASLETANNQVPGTLSKLEIANSEASSNQIQSENQLEKDVLVPVTASDDVTEGTPPGPLNDALTEPSGTHSIEQHDERESDPELEPWIPMLSQLYKVLIEPIVEFLPDKDENPRVTFIPQDFLLKVPFAALQGEARDNYIMEDFVISTSPAIHFLELACASRETAELATAPLELSLLAVGNPIMPFEELPQLPSAQREVRMINEIINSPKSEVLIGSRAKKKDVMTAMPKHKILHFATHAIVDDGDSHGDFSMKGLIVLTRSGLECNGILTAEEVRGMELKAELVVLSCCDTGLGKVTGDGVLGLSRAFLAAGAACVIVTLWKIDDRSASELMTSFYREYKASRDAAVSLQRAMKILQANENTRSPQHWAAFSIVGATKSSLSPTLKT